MLETSYSVKCLTQLNTVQKCKICKSDCNDILLCTDFDHSFGQNESIHRRHFTSRVWDTPYGLLQDRILIKMILSILVWFWMLAGIVHCNKSFLLFKQSKFNCRILCVCDNALVLMCCFHLLMGCNCLVHILLLLLHIILILHTSDVNLLFYGLW